MARAPRLKIFQTRIGLSDWVVAASSQKAALRAWDIHVNLFASGAASETRDPRAIALALKADGQPVAVKTYSLSAGDVAKPASYSPAKRAETTSQSKRQSKVGRDTTRTPPPPPPPDRSRLDAAEEAVRTFQQQAARQRAAVEKRREAASRGFDTEAHKIDGQEQAVLARLERERRRFDALD